MTVISICILLLADVNNAQERRDEEKCVSSNCTMYLFAKIELDWFFEIPRQTP